MNTDLIQIGEQLKSELEKFGKTVTALGGNFAVSDLKGNIFLHGNAGRYETDWNSLKENFSQIDTSVRKTNQEISVIEENVLAAVVRPDSISSQYIILIDAGSASTDDMSPISGPESKLEIFSEMLSLLSKKLSSETNTLQQAEKFTNELSQVYEELALIYKLSTNMNVKNTVADYLQLACDSLTEIVNVEGIVILLEQNTESEKRLVLTAGSGLIDIDQEMTKIIRERIIEVIAKGKEALLDSDAVNPFRYKWPKYIKSIIAVPLLGKDRNGSPFSQDRNFSNHLIGIMVAVNRLGKTDFDSADLKLFNSVANGCAVFVENGRLFRDMKELFLGSLKALTYSIDAKDQYTRGHSERVAFIARWLAERYADSEHLEQEQIHDIYLAGLLHDVGKIGIDDSVLRKKGRLTEEEYNCMKKHPAIGASILGEIKQMQDIIPAVLCHHERIDGKGYPNGLKGDQIPLSGKIVGLADSFDAMTSARTYRKAMNIEQALTEIKRCLGTQFDEKVGTIFLNSDVYHLWDIIQDSLIEPYESVNTLEYGADALETLIK